MAVWIITCRTSHIEEVLCVAREIHDAQAWLLKNINRRITFRDLKDEHFDSGAVKLGYFYGEHALEYWAIRMPFI